MIRICLSFLALCWAQLALAADPFTVSGVPVDARGPNAIQAQTDAILKGQTTAADLLLRRLTLDSDRARANYVAPTSDEATRLIRAMSVANEQRSTNRYIGDITVAFVPSRLSEYARGKGLTLLTTQARERVAIPIAAGQIVDDTHPLALALADPALGFSLAPVVPAKTGILRAAGIRAADLLSGNPDALTAAAAALGSQQLLLVEGAGGGARLVDIGVDTGSSSSLGTVTARTPEDLARAIAEKLQSDWKAANASVVTADPASVSVVEVTVLYDGMGDWQRLQQVLSSAARIRDARLDALTKTGATMTLRYVGDPASLRSELSGKGATLTTHPRFGTVITRPGYVLP